MIKEYRTLFNISRSAARNFTDFSCITGETKPMTFPESVKAAAGIARRTLGLMRGYGIGVVTSFFS